MMKELQITFGPYGHTLNATQVFSPDGQWVVYDTRNDDTKIISTSNIEKVNLSTGEVVTLYTTKNQTTFGPGVGAAAYHPIEDKVIFIHGLANCNEVHPYGFTRRFGGIIHLGDSVRLTHAEARKITTPLVKGALRGGTHAHSWSANGKWISFTYNDHLIELLEKSGDGKLKDLRTIGMMIPDTDVVVDQESAEEFSGRYFSFVTATVKDHPTPGSDEIDRAFDECWIGTDGYQQNGKRQTRAIAFQGNVRDENDQVVSEIFVSDVPDQIVAASGLPLQGTMHTRPNVPAGLTQRRVTFTTKEKFPGTQGPRCRLRTSLDGSYIYFHMKDSAAIVQLYRVKTTGGKPEKITGFKSSVEGQYNISPDGLWMSCIASKKIWVVNLSSNEAVSITTENDEPVVGGALWSPDGKHFVFNRYVGVGNDRYLQIFALAFTLSL